MGNRGCYAFMVSKQQKERLEWTFLFFRVSLSANIGLHFAPNPFPRKPFPFAPMTQKRDLQFLIFLKRCII